MRNDLNYEFLNSYKKGSKILIKKLNKGKFTNYCGGKVTEECIAKGKASSDPAIRKRATFAANAKKWKRKGLFGMSFDQIAGGIKDIAGMIGKDKKAETTTSTVTNLLQSQLQSQLDTEIKALEQEIKEASKKVADAPRNSSEQIAASQQLASLQKLYKELTKGPSKASLLIEGIGKAAMFGYEAYTGLKDNTALYAKALEEANLTTSLLNTADNIIKTSNDKTKADLDSSLKASNEAFKTSMNDAFNKSMNDAKANLLIAPSENAEDPISTSLKNDVDLDLNNINTQFNASVNLAKTLMQNGASGTAAAATAKTTAQSATGEVNNGGSAVSNKSTEDITKAATTGNPNNGSNEQKDDPHKLVTMVNNDPATYLSFSPEQQKLLKTIPQTQFTPEAWKTINPQTLKSGGVIKPSYKHKLLYLNKLKN